MVWEALGSALIGLAAAALALRWFPERFPARALTTATGPAGGLVGGVIMLVVVGPGCPPLTFAAALAVSAAAVSLLVHEPTARRSAAPLRPLRPEPDRRARSAPRPLRGTASHLA